MPSATVCVVKLCTYRADPTWCTADDTPHSLWDHLQLTHNEVSQSALCTQALSQKLYLFCVHMLLDFSDVQSVHRHTVVCGCQCFEHSRYALNDLASVASAVASTWSCYANIGPVWDNEGFWCTVVKVCDVLGIAFLHKCCGRRRQDVAVLVLVSRVGYLIIVLACWCRTEQVAKLPQVSLRRYRICNRVICSPVLSVATKG